MDRTGLFNRLRRERTRKNAISPIIATLLLILIAIAAGVVVYAYVLGFVGNTTNNTGNNTSVISVENVCISAGQTCTSGGSSVYGFVVIVRNQGSTTISLATSPAVYLSDSTAQSVPTEKTVSCGSGSVSPGSTFTCTGTGGWTSAPSAGDSVTAKVVVSDGGTASQSSKTIA